MPREGAGSRAGLAQGFGFLPWKGEVAVMVTGRLSEPSKGCPDVHAGGWPGPFEGLGRLVLPNSGVHAYGGWLWSGRPRSLNLVTSPPAQG